MYVHLYAGIEFDGFGKDEDGLGLGAGGLAELQSGFIAFIFPFEILEV